jgi:hypothetical protein
LREAFLFRKLSLFSITFLIMALLAPIGLCAPFTPGNLVIYRVGSGTGSLINTGNPVFLDEYTPAGVLVQSIPLPTEVSGANRRLVASGTATTEGLLTRSANGSFLILTGYDSSLPGTVSLPGTDAATVNRVVGRVDHNGNIDTTTALTDYSTGSNPRSAASTNGTDIWIAGGAGGVRHTTLGSTTSTSVSTTVTNLRQINIFDGQLYVSTSSGSAVRIGMVGTGTPTTSGQTIVNLPGFVTAGSPYAFFFADLDAGVAGVDTLYVADDGADALRKYSLVGGNWVLNGTIGVNADNYTGVTATVSGSTVTLYAVRMGGSGAGGGGQLVSLVDSSGYNGPFAGTPTLLATAAANTAFRGVALAPAAGGPVTNALISGRVTTSTGRGLPFARLTLTGSALPQPRIVIANAFGYYRFLSLPTGASYTVSVAAKQKTFTQPSQVINLTQDVTNANFVANAP